jgi:hypothetical protein
VRASVREGWFESEGFPGVSGECFSDRVHLLLEFWHVPGFHDSLHNSHVAGEELAGIGIQVRIGRDYSNLTEVLARDGKDNVVVN